MSALSTEQAIDVVVSALVRRRISVSGDWKLVAARRDNRALILVFEGPDGQGREHTFCQTSQGPADG